MAGLLNKLRMMDAAPKKEAPAQAAEPREGSFYRTFEKFPLSLFADEAHATPNVLRDLYGSDFPDFLQRGEILFLDTETTGLGGGAGTLAFEVGLGYFTDTDFTVEQFAIRDYTEEPAMLTALAAVMSRFRVLCTFNGRSFDGPLLQSRFLMNRISARLPEFHADCLYPARRVWKLRLKDCTLSSLESHLLGVHREDDLPGAQVPEVFFRYLKDRDFKPVQRVLDHNRQDIVSLAQLFYHLCLVTDRPDLLTDAQDLYSMARLLEQRSDLEKSRACFQMSSRGIMKGPSLEALALQEKRYGSTDMCLRLYRSMLKQNHRPAHACQEIAKIYEHRLKDPERALAATRQALLLLSEPSLKGSPEREELQESLKHRYVRLSRKCAAKETIDKGESQ